MWLCPSAILLLSSVRLTRERSPTLILGVVPKSPLLLDFRPLAKDRQRVPSRLGSKTGFGTERGFELGIASGRLTPAS